MCVILYNTCETGHIESSVLLSLSASWFYYELTKSDSKPNMEVNLNKLAKNTVNSQIPQEH